MVGCSLERMCKTSKYYCSGFSILSDICTNDMPKMKGCLNYQKICAEGSVVLQCRLESMLPSLPTTRESRSLVADICSEMDMKGCSDCKEKHCDSFAVYVDLCHQMPNMSQCKVYTSMCQRTPTLPFCLSSDHSDPALAPAMKMFFHFGINDYILFEEWVPRSGWSYLLGLVFCASLGIV
jgi:copper transporter 1